MVETMGYEAFSQIGTPAGVGPSSKHESIIVIDFVSVQERFVFIIKSPRMRPGRTVRLLRGGRAAGELGHPCRGFEIART